jgi:hypothetical protein
MKVFDVTLVLDTNAYVSGAGTWAAAGIRLKLGVE